MRGVARLVVVGLLGLTAGSLPRRAGAQELALADRGPRFLLASARAGAATVEIEASRNAMLRQVVSLNLEAPVPASSDPRRLRRTAAPRRAATLPRSGRHARYRLPGSLPVRPTPGSACPSPTPFARDPRLTSGGGALS
jgi:hypothetical protein